MHKGKPLPQSFSETGPELDSVGILERIAGIPSVHLVWEQKLYRVDKVRSIGRQPEKDHRSRSLKWFDFSTKPTLSIYLLPMILQKIYGFCYR